MSKLLLKKQNDDTFLELLQSVGVCYMMTSIMGSTYQRSPSLWSTYGKVALLSHYYVSNIMVRRLMHDEAVYKNPSAFDPERFIPGEITSAVPPDPRNFVFGFGRRYGCAIFLLLCFCNETVKELPRHPSGWCADLYHCRNNSGYLQHRARRRREWHSNPSEGGILNWRCKVCKT